MVILRMRKLDKKMNKWFSYFLEKKKKIIVVYHYDQIRLAYQLYTNIG